MFKQDKLWTGKLADADAGQGTPARAKDGAQLEAGPSASTPDPETALPAFLQTLQSALQPPTRHAAQLPNSADLTFHKTLDRPFGRSVDAESSRLLSLVERVRTWVAESAPSASGPGRRGLLSAGHNRISGKGKQQQAVTDRSLDEDEFGNTMGDLIDHLLERADTCLDEYAGKVVPKASTSISAISGERQMTGSLQNGKNMGKLPRELLNASINPLPQTSFSTPPNNRSDVPWTRPFKFGRPHAKPTDPDWVPPVPRDAEGRPLPEGPRQGAYMMEDDPRKHPYHYEIITSEPPPFAFEQPGGQDADGSSVLVKPADLDPANPEGEAGVPFKWVRTVDDVRQLLLHLQEDRVKDIAIDLEHHSFRTYQGLVCLMQLSTRWGDYIVDTLSDEVRENAELLNEVFADPGKVKVLHGADHDVLWLQRDLGLYLVGLFDTYHASHVLEMPQHGLAFLLQRYCGFEADKRYQLADWRIRPLPNPMVYYARSDTHSLLYIYDRIRAELSAKAGGIASGREAIRQVFERSKRTATKVYAKPVWSEEGEGNDGWRQLWSRMTLEGRKEKEEKALLGLEHSKEMRLVKAVHKWRDEVAREMDESPRYILSAAHLLSLANRAPRTKAEVLALFSPALPALRSRADEVAALIDREVIAWEQERDTARERVISGLPVGPEVMMSDGDEGEDAGIVIAAPVAAVHVAAMQVNTAIWPLSPQQPHSSSTSLIIETSIATPSAPRLLAPQSALFDAADVRPHAVVRDAPTQTLKAAKKARATRSLFAMPESGNPFANVSLQDQECGEEREEHRTRKVNTIRREFATAMVHVLQDGLVSSTTRLPPLLAAADTESTEQADANLSMEPETVAFVPKAQRKTIVDRTSSRYDSLFVKQAPASSTVENVDFAMAADDAMAQNRSANGHTPAGTNASVDKSEDVDAEVIQVGRKVDEDKLSRRQEKKKRKRELKQQQQVASAAGDSASVDGDADGAAARMDEQGGSPNISKRRKSGNKSQTTAEYDFSNELSILDAPRPSKPAPASAPKKSSGVGKKGNSKAAGAGGKAAGGQGPSGSSAPRKRNELGSGNKSFTFRS
ncbi:hypothetical protein K437DRAFT_230739 [Tilletiaria anomala UBC 951]|uniref:HRDC domain-containing protein n=1 Tax=Tilletiaria anomala (strain ATCC 24038 / CBS 436.72 / UBC 951) TaxID=1037660 RepID=A0A066WS03_TILAU|nr:uncharacterized protein K437DRAFT_230739 [Tilletiaria anomala UBC 951]KDN53450.1 hypothetical protein K437DRAFT_230739 [Tilletiaria anomala UBC 951]